jgi:hypothetical protein
MLRSVSKPHDWNSISWKVSGNSVSKKKELAERELLLRRLRDRLFFLTDDNLGAWNEIKLRLKKRFNSLTDDDLYLLEGREDELLYNVLRKVGDNIHNLKILTMVL